ncbi:MAG TPA: glycoside hydrolase family 2 TIM barrel-domain containing protein [Pseudonocardiaceae bacterium]|nr:glycoside hydrolase family 2 TIM barrel-domain containing protein [Pseudonocardiaceae bacterium]
MTGERRPGTSRRRFLIGLGIGVVGATSLGTALLGSTPQAAVGALDDQWLFGEYAAGCTDVDFDDSRLATVSVPHCVTPLSWQNWDPAGWENLWVYRQHFDVPAALRSGRVFLRLDGVLSTSEVHVNGTRVGHSDGGYLPLDCELTGLLRSKGNVVAVTVDGRWRQDVPPDLPRFADPDAIDFYQPAGIYRPVTILGTPTTYLADVFAEPVDVLTADRGLTVRCTVDSSVPVDRPISLTATLAQDGTLIASSTITMASLPAGTTSTTLGLTGLGAVRLWDVTDPALCDVEVTLAVDGTPVHQYAVRTGFREARFTEGGFFLNGRRLTLFGVNRHQWYPFVGGAMPDRVQRRDAQILKVELNCTMVRCSHYPQSTAFLDACDELGIMVWEEIPGWDHLGDSRWQDTALRDVHDMVARDRNHPSVIVWGSRVNETFGQVSLYDRTDLLAQELDPSRPCSGAVKGRRGYEAPLYRMRVGESVFAFNDYSPLRGKHAVPRLRPPRSGIPYLVSEAIGSLVGHPHYRRVDPVAIQSDQALLHAWVHERAAADDRYCGLLAWCGFDYPSGWARSVDGVKYPGVVDFFRIPKLGAAFYQSQVDPARRVVIEPAFYWDFGPGSPPDGPGAATIWSNCDTLRVHVGGRHVATARPERRLFPHLAHPPFVVHLTVRPHERLADLRIDGYLGTKLALRRRFSPDPTRDQLSCAADDHLLTADGADTTRLVIRALDRYGAPRPYVSGLLSLAIDGPGVLIGDNPLDFEATGGAAAVWVRTLRGQTGPVTVTAAHPTLGSEETVIEVA